MPRFPVIAGISVILGLAAVALWIDHSATPAPQLSVASIQGAAVSAGPLYSAKFSDLQGRVQTLGQWDRKLLILNFWATWCGPCKEEMPILAKLQSRYGEQNLQIVGIAADSLVNVTNFATSMNINYPVFVDERGAIEFSKRLGNRLGLLPHTVVLSPGGSIIYNKLGTVTELELAEIIRKNTKNMR